LINISRLKPDIYLYYAENKGLQIAPDTFKKWTSKPCNNSNIITVFNSDCITAPTYSQAFRWFREKHNLHSGVSVHTLLDENDEDRDEYYFSIRKLKPVEAIHPGLRSQSPGRATRSESRYAILKKIPDSIFNFSFFLSGIRPYIYSILKNKNHDRLY